jgi:Ring finger domain
MANSTRAADQWGSYEYDETLLMAQQKQRAKKRHKADALLKQFAAVTLERDASDLLKSLLDDNHHRCSYDDNVTSTECLVCLAPYRQGDVVVSLSCGHSYHAPCLKEWLIRQCHCPYCRHDLEADRSATPHHVGASTTNDDDVVVGLGSPLSWRVAKVVPQGHNDAPSLAQSFQHRHQLRRKTLLVHVLQQQQEALRHEWHQKTVLQQLSFSPVVEELVA